MSKLNLKDRVPRNYDAAEFADLLYSIQDQVNRLTEGRQSAYHGASTAAPSTGTWVSGDWVKNSAPTAGGYFGWVYTPSGWKGFGVIEA